MRAAVERLPSELRAAARRTVCRAGTGGGGKGDAPMPVAVRAPAPIASASSMDDAAFAALMRRLGPFEPAAHVAVAVSGGSDSLCLALLADAWARAQGGRITGLIVDHGLRAEAAAEARHTRNALAEHGIEAVILPWRGAKPTHGIQAAARDARYARLTAWCRAHHVLHLLLGHHEDDVAETVRLRAERGSGPHGLAAMPAVVERDGVRWLRPFLPVAKATLQATLTARGVRWIEDPSNRDEAFARVRLRQQMDAASRSTALGQAARAGSQRRADSRWLADFAARHITVTPAGFATVGCAALHELSAAQRAYAVERLVLTIGNRAYPPRTTRLAGALSALGDGRPTTLHGCRLLARQRALHIFPEYREPPLDVTLPVPGAAVFAGRFYVRCHAGQGPAARVTLLGGERFRALRCHDARLARLPAALGARLPVLLQLEGLRAMPQFLIRSEGYDHGLTVTWCFAPRHALIDASFW